MDEISRVRGGETHPLPRARVGERELVCVQPLPRQAETRRQRRVGAVERVAHTRVPVRGHVHTDLVMESLPSGVTANFHECEGCRPIGASMVPASGSG